MDIIWIKVFTTGIFSGFCIIIWDSVAGIQHPLWSAPLSCYPPTYCPVPRTAVLIPTCLPLLGVRDAKSTKLWFLPGKHQASSRRSGAREHSACNREDLSHTCALQVVEINGADLKYIEENSCSHPGIISRSDWNIFALQTYGRNSLINPRKVYLPAWSKFKSHSITNLC